MSTELIPANEGSIVPHVNVNIVRPGGGRKLKQVGQGTTIRTLIENLGLPEAIDQYRIELNNSAHFDWDNELVDGDVLFIVPNVDGGE